MTQFTIDTHVADIVTVLPQSADFFRSLRIDFCCGGKISLKEAAEAQDLNPDRNFKAINSILKITVKNITL